MANSTHKNISFILDFVTDIEPSSILDVGAGFGKWGFLFRCHIGYGLSLIDYPKQKLKIDAVEIFKKNISPVYSVVYNRVYENNILDIADKLQKYDVIICGDIIEHLEKKDALELISLLQTKCNDALILSIPLGNCPQGKIYENEFERHLSVWRKSDFKNAYIKKHHYIEDVYIATVIYPVSLNAKWVVSCYKNPLKRFITKHLIKHREK